MEAQPMLEVLTQVLLTLTGVYLGITLLLLFWMVHGNWRELRASRTCLNGLSWWVLPLLALQWPLVLRPLPRPEESPKRRIIYTMNTCALFPEGLPPPGAYSATLEVEERDGVLVTRITSVQTSKKS